MSRREFLWEIGAGAAGFALNPDQFFPDANKEVQERIKRGERPIPTGPSLLDECLAGEHFNECTAASLEERLTRYRELSEVKGDLPIVGLVSASPCWDAEVVGQKQGEILHVSFKNNTVTFYSLPWQEKGLLRVQAHNYLSPGNAFLFWESGDKLHLVQNDREARELEVSAIIRAKAMSPMNPFSNFRLLHEDGSIDEQEISSTEMYFKTHGNPEFDFLAQTCISLGSDISWGRLFVGFKKIAI